MAATSGVYAECSGSDLLLTGVAPDGAIPLVQFEKGLLHVPLPALNLQPDSSVNPESNSSIFSSGSNLAATLTNPFYEAIAVFLFSTVLSLPSTAISKGTGTGKP